MGMTLNEAIEHGKEQLDIFGGEHKEFIKTAIETMRKYQKISDAIKFADDNGLGYEYIGEKVYEVFIYDR